MHPVTSQAHATFFVFSSRRRHTRYIGDWSSDVALPISRFTGWDEDGHAMSCEPPRLRSHWRLVAASMAGVVAEAVLLWALGLRASIAVAPQVSAPAPFGVFHDLRWLLVFTRSWMSYAWATVVMIAVRSALTASFARLA